MHNWNGPTVKHVWNNAVHGQHTFLGFHINTTVYHLGQYILHLLLLKSSMLQVDSLGRRWLIRLKCMAAGRTSGRSRGSLSPPEWSCPRPRSCGRERWTASRSLNCNNKNGSRSVSVWQNFQSLGQFLRVYLLFGKILNRHWQFSYAIGQLFIGINGQMLKNNLAIWSHWSR